MAPIGNTYTEKWTYERTLNLLHAIEYTSRSEDCLYLGQALDTSGLYYDIWRYWQRKWRKHHEIIQQMKSIMQRFEVRLFTRMAKKEMPERVGMFALRHHYGWGKEPEIRIGAPEDLSYVDQDLVNETQKRYMEQLDREEEQVAHAQQAVPAQQQAPVAKPQIEAAPDPKTLMWIEEEEPEYTAEDWEDAIAQSDALLSRSLEGRDFQQKLKAYNLAHPQQPVSRPCVYIMGSPLPGMPHIPFDGGFFLTEEMMQVEEELGRGRN